MATIDKPLDTLDRDVLEGKWQQLQGALRERWGRLTDDDLMQIAGKRDRFLGVLQERYGYSRQEATRVLDDFLQAYREKKDALNKQGNWLTRNREWLVLAAFTATIGTLLAYYFKRSDLAESY